VNSVIDDEGFRANVAIILVNGQGQSLWFKRVGQEAWQFPQGGMKAGETVEQAMYRELEEEVGLTASDVSVVASTKGWLRYRLPKKLVRYDSEPVCIGQKQKWFLLQLTTPESAINLERHNSPEFDRWQWVSYWYPLEQVVSFKKEVYRRALKELTRPHSRLVEDLRK
jgi:putative (di)nucleoside polyphosphate hydrolase